MYAVTRHAEGGKAVGLRDETANPTYSYSVSKNRNFIPFAV